MLATGSMVGGHEILGLLGRGGMGEVYRARQVSMQRIVALKILAPTLAQKDPAFALRFVEEARAAGRFNNPSIIHVHDVDRCPAPDSLAAQGITHLDYFSMELVEGESVQAVIDRDGHCPDQLIARVMLGMASALSYAEQEGIVHRDIKPDNIMLGHDGTVKLADLGLAQPVADQSAPVDQERDAQGRVKVMGTPLYMSPQQARGLPVDHRSDQYSLGATLWHMLAGKPPYRGADNRGTMVMHVRDPIPDPRDRRADAPQSWSLLAMRLMAKDPAHRFATSSELKDAVRAAAKGIAPDRVDAPRPPAKPIPWALIGVIFSGLGGLGLLLWMLIGTPATPEFTSSVAPLPAPAPTPVEVAPSLPPPPFPTAPSPATTPDVPDVPIPPLPPAPGEALPPVVTSPWRDLATELAPLRAKLDYLKIRTVIETARSSFPAEDKTQIDALIDLGTLASTGESALRSYFFTERPTIMLDGAEGRLSRMSLSEVIWTDTTGTDRKIVRAEADLDWAALLDKALTEQGVERPDEVRAASLWMWRQPGWTAATDRLDHAPLAQALRKLE